MKLLVWLFIILTMFVSAASAQTDVDNDLFDVYSNHSLVLKPAIEHELLLGVERVVTDKSVEFTYANRSLNKEQDEITFKDDSLFFADTFRIERFVEAFMSKPSGGTTLSLNWIENWRIVQYEQLLAAYYAKAMYRLNDSFNGQLKLSQQRWQEYYEQEKDFIFNLNYFGNHNSYLFNWPHYLDIVCKRLYFVRDIYLRRFNGDGVFKE